MRTLKTQVEQVLIDLPETRNSDIALTIEIWKRFYPKWLTKDPQGNLYVPLARMYDLPREDNVKRIRAKFNSNGKYYPTDIKVAKARGINEQSWRVALGYPETNQTYYPTKAPSYTENFNNNV